MAADSFLHDTLAHHWLWDVARYVCVLMGGALAVFTIKRLVDFHRYPGSRDAKSLAMFISFALFGLMAATQELVAIGEPIVVWRLPLLLIGTINAMVAMYLDDVENRHPHG